MGIAQQWAKFTPELASQSAPLRDFLSMKNQWLWTDIHDQVFQNVKKLLTSPVTLKLYDVSRPTKLRVDGSRLNGIAVILYEKHGTQSRVHLGTYLMQRKITTPLKMKC